MFQPLHTFSKHIHTPTESIMSPVPPLWKNQFSFIDCFKFLSPYDPFSLKFF